MPFNLIRRLGLAALFCMAAPYWAAAQTGLPAAPCGDQAPTPAYAPERVPPAAGVWQGAALREAGWQPPPCLGWTGDSRLVVTLASTFRSGLSVDQLVARLASISSYPGVKYWSISHQEWRPIAVEAAIVGAPAASGFDYSERGDLNGTSTYRFRVIEKSAEGAVVASENVAPIRILIVTAFAAGALQLATFLRPAGPSLWHLYQITRVGADSSSLVASYEGSYLNRLDAFRRYLAGEPTDRAPPLVAK
jgi:hypothetical protein